MKTSLICHQPHWLISNAIPLLTAISADLSVVSFIYVPITDYFGFYVVHHFKRCIVIVQDKTAFEARYGTQINIAGQYTGRLANGGERIRLEDAIGQTILDFSYKDGWYDGTDGQGFSLVIIDPFNPDPTSWDDKDSWRAGTNIGGSPGRDE